MASQVAKLGRGNPLNAETEGNFTAVVKVVGDNPPDRPLAGDRIGLAQIAMPVCECQVERRSRCAASYQSSPMTPPAIGPARRDHLQ